MNKKNVAAGLLAAAVATTAAFGLAGCGNYDLMDMHYELYYAVIEENGHQVLHQIEKWADSESESVTISTRCCGNYIWTSANRSVLYKSKPSEDAYDYECGHAHDAESNNTTETGYEFETENE